MVEFVPMPMIAHQPDAGGQVAMPGPESTGPKRPYFSARCPISRSVDLNEMASGTLLSGSVYRRDFFLCGPIEGAVQGLWLGASVAAAQANFKIGLVDEGGDTIAELQSLTSLPSEALLLLNVASETSQRSIYLRVETEAQDALLYVTLDATLDEVM